MPGNENVLNREARLFAMLGGVNAGLAVLLGAFGSHALRETLPAGFLETFDTAVEYHFIHSLGLFAVAFVASHRPGSASVRWSGRLMAAGIVLFSGSLYSLSLTGVSVLGAITPLGGACFIAAWALVVAALAHDRRVPLD